jgi:L-ascorbate metabolism protein UlaG (beta-lactamase superfamily)
MKIKHLGHAAFELALDSGVRIVFDPYTPGAFDAIDCAPIEGEFDAAVVSHDHDDHCCREVLLRARKIINKAGRVDVGGVWIETAPTFHDEAKGAKRGKNLVSVVDAEGLRVAHLGDLGHKVSAKDVPILKGVDVLLIPVGGYFTIDAGAAATIVKDLEPKIVIPMHYLTLKVTLPIAPVENFTRLMDNVEKAGASEIVVTKETLPAKTKVVVLEAAN